jgi:hypothetical protein
MYCACAVITCAHVTARLHHAAAVARVLIACVLAVCMLLSSPVQAQQPAPYPYPQPPPPYPQPAPYPAQPTYPAQPGQPYPAQPAPYPYPRQPYPYAPPAAQPPSAFPPPAQPKTLQAEYQITEPIYALVVGGVVSFSVAYLTPLIVAGAQGFNNGSEWLGIPMFGPFVTIGKREWGRCPDRDECNDDVVGVGLAMSAIFQALGVGLFLPGILLERTRTERVYAVTPLVTDDSVGLSMSGHF